MTTISEDTFSPAKLIDELADAAVDDVGDPWTEPESGSIENDQSTNDWHNNARLLHHDDAGLYLLMYVTEHEFHDIGGPIRLVYSNDWNSDEDRPAGKTTVTGDDPFENDVGNHQNASYNQHEGGDDYATGLWALRGDSAEYNPEEINDRIDAAELIDVTAFASVGENHFTVALWNTKDSDNGAANWHAWQHIDSKFWDDGTDPWAFEQTLQRKDERFGGYGWEAKGEDHGVNNLGGHSCMGHEADWGFINPDTNDDTYFFKRPVIYSTDSLTVPVAYFEPAIMADKDEGGAHGDIVTYDGTDYQIFQQSGEGESQTVSVGLRYT